MNIKNLKRTLSPVCPMCAYLCLQKILKQVEYESARRKNMLKRNQKKRGTRPNILFFFFFFFCFILHKTATKTQGNSRKLKGTQGSTLSGQKKKSNSISEIPGIKLELSVSTLKATLPELKEGICKY